MAFKWFWNRISDEWIVSNPAAVLFGLAAAFTCLLTVFLFSSLPIGDDGIWPQTGWGIVGVLGPLGALFLWAGMRRYQKMRGQSRFGDTRLVRLLMLIGLCWTAVVYYLAIFLPKRRETPESLSALKASPSKPRSMHFGIGLIAAWVIYLLAIQAMFFAPKAASRLLHGNGWVLLLAQVTLMVTTAAYLVIRFVRGSARN